MICSLVCRLVSSRIDGNSAPFAVHGNDKNDRARIVFDCRMADDPAMMSLAAPTYEKTK